MQLTVATVVDMPEGLTATFLGALVFIYGYRLNQICVHIENI